MHTLLLVACASAVLVAIGACAKTRNTPQELVVLGLGSITCAAAGVVALLVAMAGK